MFNHKRLGVARKRRRLTAKRLAECAGVSPVTITRLENGYNEPDEATVARIAEVLGYPSSFFFGDDPELVDAETASFRSLKRMSAKERDAALAAGTLGIMLAEWVEERFSVPEPNLIDLGYEADMEAAARCLRQHFGIGERPVGSMIRLLEAHGVRVFSLDENTANVDAFSFWKGDKPFVFLNNFKTPEHSVFDAAHELGHLVLHKHGGFRASNDQRLMEQEANKFASAFLMPEDGVRSRMPCFITVETVIRAKARWRVSAMAMTYRLRSLGLLTDWQYKSICIELARRGYRSGEPEGIEREKSAVWAKVFSQLWREKTTKAEVAESLGLPLDEIEALVKGTIGNGRWARSTEAGVRPCAVT